VSFELRAGEVLGLTGLVGSGYEDSVYAIFGAIPAENGTLVVDGERRDVAAMTPKTAMAHGIALVPGDRQNTGSIPTLPASDNINLLVLDRYFRGGRLRQNDLDHNAQELMAEFDVRPARPDLDYGSFSGGNQQKAMMAKWKQIEPRVLLLHEPTQGVDVGARQQIWTMIRAATGTTSTICASSDYEQLATICDRVGVIARGRLVGFLTGADVTKERIAEYCLRSSADASVTALDGSGA
jgi:ribose transport system ATP-binding protein